MIKGDKILVKNMEKLLTTVHLNIIMKPPQY